MSTALTFRELESQIRRHYATDEYAQIIDLVDREGQHFPEQKLFLSYWQIGMAARLGKPTLAFHFMDELLGDGLWISEILLRQSPSLEDLQGLMDFEERVRKFGKLQTKEVAQLLPLFTLRSEGHCSSQDDPCPLLVGLHTGRGIALDSIRFWRPAATNDWFVGVPQSSQAIWSGAYVWEDREFAQDEIETQVGALKEKYFVDPRRILLAGHAQGGEMAIWLPLSGGLDACGFIAIGPRGSFMDDPNQWIKLLQARLSTGIRGAIIAGELDGWVPMVEVRRTVEICNRFDVHCRLEVLSRYW